MDDLGDEWGGSKVREAFETVERDVATVIVVARDLRRGTQGGDGLLEVYPAADNKFELGGFARLKQWLVRARVGFYLSTPSYRRTFELHGWGDIAEQAANLTDEGVPENPLEKTPWCRSLPSMPRPPEYGVGSAPR